MRKRLLTLLCTLFAVFASFGFASCDLNHHHVLNQYGFCNNCQTDTAITLTRNANGEYVSNELTLNTENETFIKFVANGESGIQVCFEERGAKINTLNFFSGKSALITGTSGATLSWNNTLETGVTYYVRIKLYQGGNAVVRISPLNNA